LGANAATGTSSVLWPLRRKEDKMRCCIGPSHQLSTNPVGRPPALAGSNVMSQ
jgi:hypothetical protein